MKKLLLIALVLSFSAVNAQLDRQHFVPNSTQATVQSYIDDHPGNPILFDLNRNNVKKTDNHPVYPVIIDPYRNAIMKPDNHPNYPYVIDAYRNAIMMPYSHPDNPIVIDPNRYTIRRTD